MHLKLLFFSFILGVWGSAFSILFNRVLGVSGSQNKGSTMEEELGIVKGFG
jgi:phospholipase A2